METIRKTINYFSSYWIVVLYGSAFYVFIKTGQFSEISRPDAPDILPHYQLLYKLFAYSTAFVVLGLILNLFFILKTMRFKIIVKDFSFIFFIINAMLWLLTLVVDYFRVLEWFLD